MRTFDQIIDANMTVTDHLLRDAIHAVIVDAIYEAVDHLEAEVTKLRAELETERMRLAACGVVALANTPESAKAARDMHPDYRSASCDDVARMVYENMKLRAALRDYGQHLRGCDAVRCTGRDDKCDCGFDAIRARGEK